MKAVTSIAAATAALALGGGLFAAQAMAEPTTPTAPTPTTPTKGAGQGQGVGWLFTALTDVQRSCLADAGVQRPDGRLSDAQAKELRAVIDAALAKCEVKVPDRLAGKEKLGFRWAALSAEQQKCLADISLTRPVGRLTETQRAAVRQAKLAAVSACGIGR